MRLLALPAELYPQIFAAVLRLLDYYSRKCGTCQQKKKSFFNKMKKSERPFRKGQTVAFSRWNVCCPGLVFHHEEDSWWKRKRPETEVSGLLVEISGIEPLTS